MKSVVASKEREVSSIVEFALLQRHGSYLMMPTGVQKMRSEEAKLKRCSMYDGVHRYVVVVRLHICNVEAHGVKTNRACVRVSTFF
jgi:hypothetical protein